MEFVAVINAYIHLICTIEVNAEVRQYLRFLYEVFTNFCTKSDNYFFGVFCVECTGTLFQELVFCKALVFSVDKYGLFIDVNRQRIHFMSRDWCSCSLVLLLEMYGCLGKKLLPPEGPRQGLTCFLNLHSLGVS